MTATGSAVDLPHDWAIELPFQNDPALASKGFYPLGRELPGDQRRLVPPRLRLPAADAGKRITIEFDGAYRETHGRLQRLLHRPAQRRLRSLQLRRDRFRQSRRQKRPAGAGGCHLSDGWFYEGAGIYRHVWLVKTHPVHVKKWGTFVASKCSPGTATVSIRTEVENHGEYAAERARDLHDPRPAGQGVGKAASRAASVRARRAADYAAAGRGEAAGALVAGRTESLQAGDRGASPAARSWIATRRRFGIRTLKFDAEQGFFLNGKPVKVKGTCNHQDHAGVGAALPDAVQYFRIRKLQEMGCNAIRTSHNPPTPELLDACDELGMLVLDETRMMSSNPEGLQPVREPDPARPQPSERLHVVHGQRRSIRPTDTGLRMLTAMKRVAPEARRLPAGIASRPRGAIGTGGLAVCDVHGLQLRGPAGGGVSQGASRQAGDRARKM